jgi:hypothetical protein
MFDAPQAHTSTLISRNRDVLIGLQLIFVLLAAACGVVPGAGRNLTRPVAGDTDPEVSSRRAAFGLANHWARKGSTSYDVYPVNMKEIGQ